MHLVLVISSLNSGGAEKVLSQLANHWVSNGFRVTLVTLAPSYSMPFYPLHSGVHLEQLNLIQCESTLIERIKNVSKRIFYLRKLIKKLAPDVLISFIDIMNLTTIIASFGLKIPVIVSERTDPHFHSLPILYRKIRPFFYTFANRIIVQTNSAALYFSRRLQSFTQIIPNPVLPSTCPKQVTCAVQLIVTVGRLNAEKDHVTLINAFARLQKKYPLLKLIIHGEGSERANLEDLINSFDLKELILLPGITKKIDQALSQADLFVFPSLYEGFPNALCEAMAMGLPVIASNCSGNKDIIRDSVDGCLFQAGNIDQLSCLMEALINDTDKRISLSKAAQTISQRFSSECILNMWDTVIADIISES